MRIAAQAGFVIGGGLRNGCACIILNLLLAVTLELPLLCSLVAASMTVVSEDAHGRPLPPGAILPLPVSRTEVYTCIHCLPG